MKTNLREKLHEIIFEADTGAGKAFDVALFAGIILSVVAVLLESVASIREDFGNWFFVAEWIFTGLFTIEYLLRLYTVSRPARYAVSFFGIVDLLAIAPSYLSLFVVGTQSLIVVRILRLLRVFRVFKLAEYVGEASMLRTALGASARKITIFLCTVLLGSVIIGSVMHLVEGEKNGFTSIPQSIYWAIVTLTTVGYGDIAPQTVAGKMLAAAVMIMGYGIIAVPTGIVTVEMSRIRKPSITTRACTACSGEGHDADAEYCKHCGAQLEAAR